MPVPKIELPHDRIRVGIDVGVGLVSAGIMWLVGGLPGIVAAGGGLAVAWLVDNLYRADEGRQPSI